MLLSSTSDRRGLRFPRSSYRTPIPRVTAANRSSTAAAVLSPFVLLSVYGGSHRRTVALNSTTFSRKPSHRSQRRGADFQPAAMQNRPNGAAKPLKLQLGYHIRSPNVPIRAPRPAHGRACFGSASTAIRLSYPLAASSRRVLPTIHAARCALRAAQNESYFDQAKGRPRSLGDEPVGLSSPRFALAVGRAPGAASAAPGTSCLYRKLLIQARISGWSIRYE